VFAGEGRQIPDGPAGLFLGHSQFVDLLQVEPELRAGAEEVRQTLGGVAGYSPSSSRLTQFERFFDIRVEEVLCVQSEDFENSM